MKVTVGADPEVFIKDNDDNIISAIGLIGGSKRAPKYISDIISVQEDNVLAEFNIHPAKSKKQFLYFIKEGLKEVEKIVSPHNYGIAIVASHLMDDHYLKSDQALVFGCDPDINAWTLMLNEPPDAKTNLRSAGGHIHVGGIPESEHVPIVRAMDLFLGVPSVVLDQDKDRKSLYGKAGSFRDKPYGIEYRTLSNFWLKNDRLIEWAYTNTLRSVEEGVMFHIKDETELAREIVDCINNNNQKLAYQLINKYNIPMPKERGSW